MDKTLALILLFLAVGFVVYLILPKKIRPMWLLVCSLVFHCLYSKFLTCFLILTIVTVYLGGFGIEKLNQKFAKQKEGLEKEQRKALKAKFARQKRWIVVAGVVVSLGILIMLKYLGFFASLVEGFLSWFNVSASLPILKIGWPLGISYYTLTAIGYLVDVNRGKVRAGNIFQVALFISWFPQMSEGPFAQYDKLAPQLLAGEGFNAHNFSSGALKICWGIFKKIVIADRLAIVVSAVFANYATYNGLLIVLGIVFFTFQLYAEFSGFIDVARGVSEIFNVQLAKNFEQPFCSQTVSEFWRRWHISLGVWFREYVFYPVSMSKGMTKVTQKLKGFWQVFVTSAVALFAVWFCNGLWHGAGTTYLVYGLYYYVLMMIGLCVEPLSKFLQQKFKIKPDSWYLKVLRIARTFILVNIGMLIFRAPTLTQSWKMFCGIFSGGAVNLFALGVIDIPDFVLCFVGIAIIVAVDILLSKNVNIVEWFCKQHLFVKWLILVLMILCVVVFGAYGEGYVTPDPIYGAFG